MDWGEKGWMDGGDEVVCEWARKRQTGKRGQRRITSDHMNGKARCGGEV